MRTIISILSLLFLVGCSFDTDLRLTKRLNANPEIFENIINSCYQDGELLANIDKFVDYPKLSEKTKDALDELALGKVAYVVLGTPRCESETKRVVEITFDTGEHLDFTPCQDSVHKPGQHEEIKESMIDIYYLNENWTLWVDNDPI